MSFVQMQPHSLAAPFGFRISGKR